MKHYYPEDIQTVKFYGRLIHTVQYPELEERGVIIDNIIDQLGLGDFKEDLLMKAVYDLKFLATVIHVEDQSEEHELVVLPLSKLNAWLFSIRIRKDDEFWFTQETISDDGEILEERVNLRDNLARYQGECCAVLHSYWMHGIAINPNVESPFSGLSSLWRSSRSNLEKVLREFSVYCEKMGEDYDIPTLRNGINILLCDFFPQEMVMKPEECRNGYDLYRLALAEDFIARYLNQAIVEQASPTQTFTTLDADLIVAFHEIASGLLSSVNDWRLSIPSNKPV